MASWLAGRLAGWLAGWLAGRLAGGPAGWLTGWLADWLPGWPAGWLTSQQDEIVLNLENFKIIYWMKYSSLCYVCLTKVWCYYRHTNAF